MRSWQSQPQGYPDYRAAAIPPPPRPPPNPGSPLVRPALSVLAGSSHFSRKYRGAGTGHQVALLGQDYIPWRKDTAHKTNH